MTILLMTPGPTRVPERVLQTNAQAMIYHRDAEFSEALVETLAGLRPLFGTEGDVLPVHSTGRGAMEAAICNLFSPGDEVIACCNGRFGELWVELAETFGLMVHRVCLDWTQSVETSAIEATLDAHPKIKAVMAVHSDTSTGVLNDVGAIAAIARSKDKLVLVDGVSAVGGIPFHFDEWDLDVAVTSSQKCLMSSPGLAFVAISERALKACEASKLPRSYFDFMGIKRALARPRPETPGTTPVHLVLQVHEALSMIAEEGIEATFARHEAMAQMARDWANEMGLSLQCPNLKRFSPTLTAIHVPEELNFRDIRQRLKASGILIAGGIGRYETASMRIGHMGDIRPADVRQTLNALTEVIEDLKKGH
jgi:aspartate aminotransferase-like enzyme